MKKKLIEECHHVRKRSKINADSHYSLAKESKKWAFWLQLVPSVITAIATSLIVTGQIVGPGWTLSTIAIAIVSAFGNVKNPLKDYYDHLMAANSFTCLKNDSRLLGDVLSEGMDERNLIEAVKALNGRYNELVNTTLPIDDKTHEKVKEKQ